MSQQFAILPIHLLQHNINLNLNKTVVIIGEIAYFLHFQPEYDVDIDHDDDHCGQGSG